MLKVVAVCFIASSSIASCKVCVYFSLSCIPSRSFVESVTMYSWLVTVLLLASAAYSSGGQVVVCVGGWVGTE